MRLEWVPHIERFVPEWRQLHRSVPTAHPFHSPEWVTTWFDTVGRLFWPRILAGYEGDDLVMVWPFAATLRTWYVAGTGVSDYLEPLSRQPLTSEQMHAVFEFMHELRPALVDLHQLPEEFPAFPNSEAFEQATCLQKSLPPTADGLLKELSGSLRQDIRRAAKNSTLEFKWLNGAQFMPIFFELHRQRWASKRLPGAFVLRGRQRFHESFGASPTGNALHRFGVLFSESEPIGAIYGMSCGNRAFFYQSGFDPDSSKLSPGTFMIWEFMRRSIDEGVTVFDFLRGEERYKMRWAPNMVHHNVRQIWPADASLVGQVAKLHHRMDRWIREKLEG